MDVASKSMGMDFSIQWRPFFLDPRLPRGEGKDKMAHYRAKFGAERVAQMIPHMVQTFKDEGIDGYNIEGKVGNTMDSHRLLEHALATGGPAKQDALVELLFERYFLEGRALSSRACLLEAAAACDLQGAESVLDSVRYQDTVWAGVEGAYESGVTGVPYFRIDGGGRGKEVSGGQPAEVFLQIFGALGPAPTAPPPGASATAGFGVGSRVRVHALVSRPEHNGKAGTVLGPQGRERVQVRLEDGSELALKPANLMAAVDGGGGVEAPVDTA